MMLDSTLARACLVACVLAVGLSACGRRGPLERPVAAAPDAAADAAADAAPIGADEVELEDGLVPPVTPRPQQSVRTGPAVPSTPFILDPLL